jgi:NADH dehydrogenase FAD-containing subunit
MTEHNPHHSTRVVVVGGGYAGVIAANRLRLAPDLDITLVNPSQEFVERIRLHQLATGSDDAVVGYTDILGPGIELVVDAATRIDTGARQLELSDGSALPYDYLIYAVGSGSARPSVAGADEFAYPISDLDEATRLGSALAELGRDAPVCVVGAGPTGIETAAELAEQGRAVTLVAGSAVGPYLSQAGRRSAVRQLRKLGVQIVDGPGATAVAVTADAVMLENGRRLRSPLTIWTAGFAVPDLAARSGLATDTIGRLLTDETLTSVDDERIVAAGDAAAPSGQPLRMSCQAAIPLGAQAANTVLARIAGKPPAVVNQAFTGQCISLGRRAGVIQIARTDDRPLPLYIGGRAAATIKETVCKATISFLRREARKPGSYFWLKGGTRPAPTAVTP